MVIERLICSRKSSVDMMFAVRKLQELGGRARLLLFLCFIDLQVYEFTDCDLFWACIYSIWAAIRDYSNNPQVYNGMIARVWNNSDIYSEEFNAQQGLLQGCVLFPWFLKLVLIAVFLVS